LIRLLDFDLKGFRFYLRDQASPMLSGTVGQLHCLANPESPNRRSVVTFGASKRHDSSNITSAIETKKGLDHVLVLRLEVSRFVLEQLRLVVLAKLLQLAE
jgi:hypothetical protein